MSRETKQAWAIIAALFALVMVVGAVLGPDDHGVADPCVAGQSC